jgi:hypothetical protein
VWHILHAEVLALQKMMGISYKDAAHRLFLMEVEQLKKADAATKTFSSIRSRIDNLVRKDILPPIRAIDNGEFDEYRSEDGKWERKVIDMEI